MRGLHSYDYAYVRLLPHPDRGEFLNVGVLLFCRTLRFLEVRLALDEARLQSLAPQVDPAQVYDHLALVEQICTGHGPIGALGQAESFHWLVAPHNTMIQCSPVHSGLCDDPRTALEKLAREMAPR
jgi:hypothetical protein